MNKKNKHEDALWTGALYKLTKEDQYVMKTHGMAMDREVVRKRAAGASIRELATEYEVTDSVINDLLQATALYEEKLTPLKDSELGARFLDYKDPIYQRGWTVSCGNIPFAGAKRVK